MATSPRAVKVRQATQRQKLATTAYHVGVSQTEERIALKVISGLTPEQLERVLHEHVLEHAQAWAWPPRRTAAHIRKLKAFIDFHNDRDGRY